MYIYSQEPEREGRHFDVNFVSFKYKFMQDLRFSVNFVYYQDLRSWMRPIFLTSRGEPAYLPAGRQAAGRLETMEVPVVQF